MPVIIKYLRLPFTFNVPLLQQEVKAIAHQQWQLHYQVKHYEGNWSAIPLRSIDGRTDNILVSPHENAVYADTLFLVQSPYLQEVLRLFNCPLLAVRLLKLDAGALIKEHRDADLAFEKGEVRIHIPVQTNDKVEFYLDKERIPLKEGECWYMNFNLTHSIHNNSNSDRIHLVIDARVNNWVQELFAKPELLKKEVKDTGPDYDTKLQIIAQLRQMNTETGNRIADEMEASLSEKAN